MHAKAKVNEGSTWPSCFSRLQTYTFTPHLYNYTPWEIGCSQQEHEVWRLGQSIHLHQKFSLHSPAPFMLSTKDKNIRASNPRMITHVLKTEVQKQGERIKKPTNNLTIIPKFLALRLSPLWHSPLRWPAHPVVPNPDLWPMIASSSSMKMVEGAWNRANSNSTW